MTSRKWYRSPASTHQLHLNFASIQVQDPMKTKTTVTSFCSPSPFLLVFPLVKTPRHNESSRVRGHSGSVCYHRLFCFNQLEDCEGALLREGHVSSAANWKELREPMVQRYADCGLRKQLRGDAGFARPQIYDYLKDHGFVYAIRLPANAVLQRAVQPYLERPEKLEPGHSR